MLGSTQELVRVLEQVAARDQAAFQTLYDATCGKLYGVIVRIVINRSAADEILQEVYVKIWQNAADFDSVKASPITWMSTIARNRAIDEVRRSKQMQLRTTDEADDIPADIEHPLAGVERSEGLRALIGCLNKLDAEKRQVVLLAYYRGLSREQLSQRFGRPVPTIKTWLHRSLAQLRECLAQ